MKTLSKGIVFMLLSALSFAWMAAFVRLSGDLPFLQKAFFRNLVAFLIALFLFCKKLPKIHQRNLPLHLVRSVVGTVGLLGNYYAIDRLVLSDASMLNKMSPFFAVLFSVLLLKEKLSRTRLLIIIAAFIGSILVVKPTFSNLNLGATLFGFLGGMASGLAYTTVRMLAQRGENSASIVMLFSGISCLLLLPGLLASFMPMTARQWVLLLLAGTSAACGQFCITAAYTHAPAREIAVYDYSQVIFSTIIGYLLFDQVADLYSFIGYAVIIGAAILMFHYNRKRTDDLPTLFQQRTL